MNLKEPQPVHHMAWCYSAVWGSCPVQRRCARALTRWEPFEGLTSLRREMDRLFERGPLTMGDGGMFEPAVEIADTNDSIMVKAQVPGVRKENLYLDIMDDCLTLKGEIKDEETTEGKRFHRKEFRYGAFARTIPLPTAVKADQATAQLKDGVLTITIPKGEHAKMKEIPIKT
jgi:HSP20 family protein